MIVNRDLLAYARQLENSQLQSKRVQVMARIASMRRSLEQYQLTIPQLEEELRLLNKRYAEMSQGRLEL